jgi:beta-xylosidase
VVGKDIYLATSSIAWFPGVPSHHRRDLVHSWRSQQESGLDS